MSRLQKLFKEKSNTLSVYFMAGYPSLDDTLTVLQALEKTGKVDMVEIGFPFSDPVADGEVIQKSSQQALNNGMTLAYLFEQLKTARKVTSMPIVLMGYLNPVLQFGIEKFCEQAAALQIDGLIIPDLPLEVYEASYQSLFQSNGLSLSFLVAPQTSERRLHALSKASSDGFLYVVSSASITGTAKSLDDKATLDYFSRIKQIPVSKLIGFGISNKETFERACEYANGAIIGSAFIKVLSVGKNIEEAVDEFISTIK